MHCLGSQSDGVVDPAALIVDAITLWLGLFININGTFTTLHDAVIGAMAGYLSLWSVYWAFKLIRGKEGMGYGDFKLLAAIGAWLGWQQLPLIILMSSALGAIVGTAGVLLQGKGKQVPIAFGPYLAIAGWIILIAGQDITAHYFSLF